MISGWHIEESIYSDFYGEDPENPYYPRYGYRHQRLYEVQVLESRLPDVVLIHVTASDEAIRQRMAEAPHEYAIVKSADVTEIKQRFADEVDRSLLAHKGLLVEIDTTDASPQQSLDELLLKSEPHITQGELAIRQLPVPDGPYDVAYENGVRRQVPKDS